MLKREMDTFGRLPSIGNGKRSALASTHAEASVAQTSPLSPSRSTHKPFQLPGLKTNDTFEEDKDARHTSDYPVRSGKQRRRKKRSSSFSSSSAGSSKDERQTNDAHLKSMRNRSQSHSSSLGHAAASPLAGLAAQTAELFPLVSEANSLCEALGTLRVFEINPETFDGAADPPLLKVSMSNIDTGNVWVISRSEFDARLSLIRQLEANPSASVRFDPFFHPAGYVRIGVSIGGYLEGLGYNVELDERLSLSGPRGQSIGEVHIKLTPCDKDGEALGEDSVTPDPKELIGQMIYLKMTVYGVEGLGPELQSAQRLKVSFRDIFTGEDVESPDAEGHVDDLQFVHWMVTFVDEGVLNLLATKSLSISVMNHQDDGMPALVNNSDVGGGAAAIDDEDPFIDDREDDGDGSRE